MSKPKIICCWFSYNLDQFVIPEAIRAATMTFGNDAVYVVLDDGFDPADKTFIDEIKSLGAVYKQTFYNRGGHLTGHENLIGETEEFLKLTKEYPSAKVLIKTDPDTVILKRDWVDALIESKTAVMSAAYKTKVNYPMGLAQAIKTSIIPVLLKDIELYNGWFGCFDDYEFGTRLMRLCGNDTEYSIKYRCDFNDGFPIIEPEKVNQDFVKAKAVSVGWGSNHIQPEKMVEYKLFQKKVLRALYEAKKKEIEATSNT